MGGGEGIVTCAAWIRRPENEHLVVVGKSQPSSLEVFSFDSKATSISPCPKGKYKFEEGVNPVIVAASPSGDSLVCSTSTGDCKLFELYGREDNIKLKVKELLPLQGVGLQKCLAFSVDGTRFATGGVDGHLRIFEWPNMRIILDEPRAHKSFQDMDFSLDSKLLASTSSDGSARVWNTIDGVPITTLRRNSNEKIELCRFSKDGTKPFLFCSVRKGNTTLAVVWDISTWKEIGHKRLLRKPATIMSVSSDGNYLAVGSKDGDLCVVEVKKMEVRHWSKRLHLGTNVTSLEFCPSERVVLSTSAEWGAIVTKLTVPADWKEWQIYLLLLGLFLASVIAFYILFKNSDSFWNFPVANDGAVGNSDSFWNFPLANDGAVESNVETVLPNQKSDENMWENLELDDF